MIALTRWNEAEIKLFQNPIETLNHVAVFAARRRLFGWIPLLAALILNGCVTPTAPVIPATTASTWETIAPGLERRSYRPGEDYPLTQIIALRIDPAHYRFRVHYRPGSPLNLSTWRAELSGAVAFVNGNYFDPQFQALGLVVADGVAYGQAYQGMGGMLQVQNGGVRVRSTSLEPYTGEPLEQAVQAFPMLITNGQASFANPQNDRISRRTVAGQDTQGRIVLLVTASMVGMRLGRSEQLPRHNRPQSGQRGQPRRRRLDAAVVDVARSADDPDPLIRSRADGTGDLSALRWQIHEDTPETGICCSWGDTSAHVPVLHLGFCAPIWL